MLVAFIRVHLYPEYMCGRVIEAARRCPHFFSFRQKSDSQFWPPSRPPRPSCGQLLPPPRKIGPNSKNPPKLRWKKIVKLTNHTCACNDLTNFEYVVHVMTGNGCYVNLQKLAWKNSWNHFWVNLFSTDFSLLEPLCANSHPLWFRL